LSKKKSTQKKKKEREKGEKYKHQTVGAKTSHVPAIAS
jgi:hypothetical protein